MFSNWKFNKGVLCSNNQFGMTTSLFFGPTSNALVIGAQIENNFVPFSQKQAGTACENRAVVNDAKRKQYHWR